ncbi:MAG: NADH-quinone oxidoreductase subunit H [Anaerotruncus sp.]|nr:NADH-quinone oxidoreductase subunit H [Anaerotruncus sp.]
MVKLLAKEEIVPDGVNRVLLHRPAGRGAGRHAHRGAVRADGRACSRPTASRATSIVTLYLLSLMTLSHGAGRGEHARPVLAGRRHPGADAAVLLRGAVPAGAARPGHRGGQLADRRNRSVRARALVDRPHPADRVPRGHRRPDGQARAAAVRLARSGDRDRGRADDRVQRPRVGAVPDLDANIELLVGLTLIASLFLGGIANPIEFVLKTGGLLLVTAGLQSLFCRVCSIDQTVGLWWRIGMLLAVAQLFVLVFLK